MAGKVYLTPDKDGMITRFVCQGLKENEDWVGEHLGLGIWLEKKLIAGVIYHDIRPKINVWVTIYSTDKKWCNKRVLRAIFEVAFDFLNCRRISVLVSAQNTKSLKLVEGLGFKKEGVLRAFQDDGDDGLVFSMLKSECQWRRKTHE